MNTTLLGLNSSILNNDLIEKLKKSEVNSINKNLLKDIEKINESKIITEQFFNKINKILSLSEEKTINYSANLSGNNVSFDIENELNIKEGFYTFNVSSIAKREVYQSSEFLDENDFFGNELLTIKGMNINTAGKTFKELNEEINSIEGIISNIENISSNSKRLVIKSELPGEDNSLNINSIYLTKIQNASNLNLNIDGIEYNLNIETEIEKNLNNLDKKYKELSSYFISYTKLISSFELNFSSLKQLIESKNN